MPHMPIESLRVQSYRNESIKATENRDSRSSVIMFDLNLILLELEYVLNTSKCIT